MCVNRFGALLLILGFFFDFEEVVVLADNFEEYQIFSFGFQSEN